MDEAAVQTSSSSCLPDTNRNENGATLTLAYMDLDQVEDHLLAHFTPATSEASRFDDGTRFDNRTPKWGLLNIKGIMQPHGDDHPEQVTFELCKNIMDVLARHHQESYLRRSEDASPKWQGRDAQIADMQSDFVEAIHKLRIVIPLHVLQLTHWNGEKELPEGQTEMINRPIDQLYLPLLPPPCGEYVDDCKAMVHCGYCNAFMRRAEFGQHLRSSHFVKLVSMSSETIPRLIA